MNIDHLSAYFFRLYERKISPCAAIALASAICVSQPAIAQPTLGAMEKAKTCLEDSTSGRDRKVLIRWMFVSLSIHPDLSEFRPSRDIKIEADRAAAEMYTRLLTQDCVDQLKALGSQGLGEAFGHLGRVSMRELSTNKAVSTALEDFAKYIDTKKLEEAFKK